ncbi:MAG TPA: 16S rRNA (guanine(966)-N(2))-methyltransferase RsmD [Dehalococcoidia bacterium]|nr:16S rRNA (guanine(966)-N(2))-methyltransferase RsmD [Dehalococcoidia bacterium]
MIKTNKPTSRNPRVISGSAGGMRLSVASSPGVRPTSLRLRETLFSILESIETDFDEILDLYAGSGALGIEALSRSTGSAVFVERDRAAVDTIRSNLTRLRFSSRASVQHLTVEKWLPTSEASFTLVFADPPYHESNLQDTLTDKLKGFLADQAVLVLEHAGDQSVPDSICDIPLYKNRQQGRGAVAIYWWRDRV